MRQKTARGPLRSVPGSAIRANSALLPWMACADTRTHTEITISSTFQTEPTTRMGQQAGLQDAARSRPRAFIGCQRPVKVIMMEKICTPEPDIHIMKHSMPTCGRKLRAAPQMRRRASVSIVVREMRARRMHWGCGEQLL